MASARRAGAGLTGPRPDLTITGSCSLSFLAGSSKIKIRTSSWHKFKLDICHDEVRILIFDDLAENERGQHSKFYLLNFTVLAHSDMSISQDLYTSAPMQCTVPLRKSKLFIGESCPILVLTTILSNPRRANSRKCDSKIHNFPHTFFKILVRLWPEFVSVLARSQSYLQRATSGLYIFKSVILLYVQLCSGG